jgi:dihydroneopterin aldolase
MQASRATLWPTPPHPSAADSQPLDLIFIEGFIGQTVIGIHDSELHRPQPLRIDLVAGLPRPRACDTDSIVDTIDYGVVRERLVRLLAEHQVKLLEPFAETVAEILIKEFGAHWVRVVIAKPRKFDDVESVGVAIERRIEDMTPQRLAGRNPTMLQLIGAGMVPGSA